jgi:hypothetical protein
MAEMAKQITGSGTSAYVNSPEHQGRANMELGKEASTASPDDVRRFMRPAVPQPEVTGDAD